MDHLKLHHKALQLWRAHRESKWTLAGALIFDPDGRLLLLKNRLRGGWEYPAGAVNGHESPLEGCRREVAEEVNLYPQTFLFLGVDFFMRPHAPNGALFFTFATTVSAAEASQAKVRRLEATSHRWVTRTEALGLVEPRLQNRLSALLVAYDTGSASLLYDGQLPDEITQH